MLVHIFCLFKASTSIRYATFRQTTKNIPKEKIKRKLNNCQTIVKTSKINRTSCGNLILQNL